MNTIGQQLGEYRLVEQIGSGGMGQVYLARHELMGKTYAIKILPADLCRDPGFVARFRDEARVMADLRHPHIVQVHNMGFQDGTYFIVMDYVPGPGGKPCSLLDELAGRPGGRLDESHALVWAIQIAAALSHAHTRGVVHRDIKPANILIDADGKVKLTDFGLAKAIGNETILSQIHQSMKTLSEGRTISGGARAGDSLDAMTTMRASDKGSRSSDASGVLGTYDYMAPEQRGEFGGEIDPRTDIYAFGVMLYRMLTGRRPVGRFKSVADLAGIDTAWDSVINRCMEYNPADRYPAAALLFKDLRGLEGQTIPAKRRREEEDRKRQEAEQRRSREEAARREAAERKRQEQVPQTFPPPLPLRPPTLRPTSSATGIAGLPPVTVSKSDNPLEELAQAVAVTPPVLYPSSASSQERSLASSCRPTTDWGLHIWRIAAVLAMGGFVAYLVVVGNLDNKAADTWIEHGGIWLIFFYLIGSPIVASFLAKRLNRKRVRWAIGSFFFPLVLAILLFLKRRN